MTSVKKTKLGAGLYFVATPIGNARDITLRSLDILASADVLTAEDTRSLRKLMDIHGVPLEGRGILAYHDHNGDAQRPKLLKALEEGRSVAYASEAGTPLIADPGYDLSRSAASEGHLVTAAPGASAILAALTIAGLPTDRFLFAGFLPSSGSARKTALRELRDVPATLVFYESPKRAGKSLRDMSEVLGGDREAVLARELTKKFEEIRRGTLDDLGEGVAERPPKGECVILVTRAKKQEVDSISMEKMIIEELKSSSLKDAVATVVADTGLPRRQVYQAALALSKEDG